VTPLIFEPRDILGVNYMHNKEMIGMKVITSDGWTIGTVDDVAADPADWRITALEVSIAGHAAADSGTMGSVSERLVNATTRLGAGGNTSSTATPIASHSSQSDRLFITPGQIEGVVDKVTLKVTRSELLPASPESTGVTGPEPSIQSQATPGA
jgi:sporulation protein YlmC with PRC-barrel domain